MLPSHPVVRKPILIPRRGRWRWTFCRARISWRKRRRKYLHVPSIRVSRATSPVNADTGAHYTTSPSYANCEPPWELNARLFRVRRTPYAQVEQHERAKNERCGRVHVYARMRRKGREHRKGERREKEERRRTTRAYPCYTRAPAPPRTRDRRAAADFAFCSRRFFMRPIASLFQHPFYPPTRPRPVYTSPFLTLDAPGKKKNTPCFLPSFFCTTALYAAQRDFWGPFSPGLFNRRYLRCKSKRAPFLSPLFYGASLHRSINDSENRVVEPSTLVHPNDDAFKGLSGKIYSKRRSLKTSRSLAGN